MIISRLPVGLPFLIEAKNSEREQLGYLVVANICRECVNSVLRGDDRKQWEMGGHSEEVRVFIICVLFKMFWSRCDKYRTVCSAVLLA